MATYILKVKVSGYNYYAVEADSEKEAYAKWQSYDPEIYLNNSELDDIEVERTWEEE